jgi:hypothetical protein
MTMDITFLTEDQIWGDNALQVIKNYGTKTGMSDLAIVLGCYMGGSDYKTSDDQLSGYIWSASPAGSVYVRTVHHSGNRTFDSPSLRLCGARPALPSPVTSSIQPSEVRQKRKISGVQVVEYGEYPQTIAPENVGRTLEQSYKRGKLQTTGKKYTFDGEKHDVHHKPFNAKEHAEYQHNGKRYIRVEAQPGDDNSKLSNGHLPEAGEACWIEVQPIEWLKDPSGVMVARQALFAGVQFDSKKEYDGNFANTDMKQYLDRYFAKEMVAGRNVDAPGAVGSSTASVLERRETQRQRALEDPTQGL